jgi:hypothetical protein
VLISSRWQSSIQIWPRLIRSPPHGGAHRYRVQAPLMPALAAATSAAGTAATILGMVIIRARKIFRWPAWAVLCLAVQGHAAQVSGVQVTHDGARFLIDMHIAIDASPPAVFRALQDYATLARYNPDLRAVRIQPTADSHRVLLFTTIHTCVLVFCKTMHQEEIMTATYHGNGDMLEARILSRGDFKAGYGLWTVRPCPTARPATCLDVHIELVPAFWVPPAIGSWVIRRKMEEEARRTGAGLEQAARSPTSR